MSTNDVVYVARSLSAAVRGVAVLRALGGGLLAGCGRDIARREGIAWFGAIPLEAGLYVWDRAPRRFARPGKQVVVGEEVAVDLVIDWPITPRLVRELDEDAAERWWQEPLVVHVPGKRGPVVEPPAVRRLVLQARPARRREDGARILTVGPSFYWPGMELMTRADEVMGGGQSMTEWDVVRGKLPDDGAQEAADAIRRLLGL
jgi:hypothetical protein